MKKNVDREIAENRTTTNLKRNIIVGILVVLLVVLISSIITISMTSNKINKKENIAQSGEIEPREVDVSAWDTEKVDIVTDEETGAKVPVPKGYVVSGKDGEHTVNTGLVIYEGETEVTNENAWEESKTRNQWVWVPVLDSSRIYSVNSSTGKKSGKLYSYTKDGRSIYTNGSEPIVVSYDREQYFARYNMQGMTQERFLQQLQLEYEEMIVSVEKYGGYYIGRYETGDLQQKEPVTMRMRAPNSELYNTWYACYNNMKLMGANSSVQTGLIWGSLWDETLQWLVDSGNKTYETIADSTSWGNYKNAEFDYITTSGSTAHKNLNSSKSIPTGSSEYTNANNIYDLAGGYQYEWTMEAYGSYGRRYRGGYCNNTGSAYPASYRSNNYPYDYYRGASVLLYKIEAFEKSPILLG